MRLALVALLLPTAWVEAVLRDVTDEPTLPPTTKTETTMTWTTLTWTSLTATTVTATSITATSTFTTTTTTTTHNPDFLQTGECTNRFRAPERAPWSATYYNGLTINDTCYFENTSDFNRSLYGNPVFLIGDWGGINYGAGPVPADHTNASDPHKKRGMNYAVDANAQRLVAAQFNARGKMRNPDYVLNVGDNFYWGGINCPCGRPMWSHCETYQFKYIFEWIYHGPGIDGKQWLGVLGNHDYGGWRFDMGWDQAIAYTWGGLPGASFRWMQPSQFYKARVRYEDFVVDYFFLDSNVFDVKDNPWWDVMHNICAAGHSSPWVNCGGEGPANAWSCHGWFGDMWAKQQAWLDLQLRKSIVDKVEWQVVVTHFPPWWGQQQWAWLCNEYGIDLFISGHVHRQDVMAPWRWDNPIKPTVAVITGGGGGITSEFWPDNWGNDDQYGFMDMTLFKEKIKIEAISHGGQVRSTTWFGPREPKWPKNLTTNSTNSTNFTLPTSEDTDDDDDDKEPKPLSI